MEFTFAYWYLFPLGLIISSIAMATGIEGGMFWAPVYFVLVKLEPVVAVGMALITKAFGFTSGLYFHAKSKFIDYKFGRWVLFFSVPSALFGVFIGSIVDPSLIKAVFGFILVFIGFNLITRYTAENPKQSPNFVMIKSARNPTGKFSKRYFLAHKYPFVSIAGGFFLGLISVGLGPILGYSLIRKQKENIKVVISTSVFVVVITTYFAAATHIARFIFKGLINFSLAYNILLFAVPGVVIGAKYGTHLAHTIDPEKLKTIIAIFALVLGLGILVYEVGKSFM